MSEVLPVVPSTQQPPDIFTAKLLEVSPEDQTFINDVAETAPNYNVKTAHGMIQKLLNFTTQSAPDKVRAARSLWAGVFFVVGLTHPVYWVNASRINKLTGLPHSSMPEYFQRLNIYASSHQDYHKKYLYNVFKLCGIDFNPYIKGWSRYDAWIPTPKEIDSAEKIELYLKPWKNKQQCAAAILCQPSPIMTYQDSNGMLRVATEKQRMATLRDDLDSTKQRLKQIRDEEEKRAGVTGYDKVEYRIMHKHPEEAEALQNCKDQIAATKSSNNKMEALWSYIHDTNVRGLRKGKRKLWAGCVNPPCTHIFWFDLQRMCAVTGLKVKDIKAFLKGQRINPTKSTMTNEDCKNRWCTKFGIDPNGWIVLKDMQCRGY